jgi:two-component system chemotaxis sensor kinase CheA
MNKAALDLKFMADALPVFMSEAREQLASLESLLLELEDTPGDRELLDALFRCAHTIKGSAGIFGLDRIVGFTHHVENLLDQVREGEVQLTPGLSTLLLKSVDQIRNLLAAVNAASGMDMLDDAGEDERAGIVAALQAVSPASAPSSVPAAPVLGASPGPTSPIPVASGVKRWHIAVRFGIDTYRNGMDPLAIVGYLRGLGNVASIQFDRSTLPALDRIDAESCHIAVTLALDTEATLAEIESAFSFVRDDCTLTICPPALSDSDLAHRIEATPDNMRLGEILQAQSGVAPQVVQAALQRQQQQRDTAAPAHPTASAPDENRFIRVHADRLDAVINLLGELVIAGAGAALMARQTKQRGLIEANLQMARLIEEIRNGTLQLRMVPIGETFARFRRVVRDTASELGKEVALDIQGGETELDKSVVERIADPLMHLVRNALDHGLETPEQRQASGKPAQGRLSLSACHESGHIVIRIADDGRGIQRAKVLQRAWDRGLVERGVTPPETELLNLIFEPGFSTAEKVTNLSGRGVGMDVVRRNIQGLRGSIGLHSVEGQGSRIEIRLPLTLAIIDGFLIGVGPSKFIFPLDTVVEVIESQSATPPADARGCSVVELRGKVLPVVSLRHLYALESPAPERVSIVVLKDGERRFGVMVDQLLGQHQTVIKPLGRLFGSLRGMSGSSILGNGEVALIFDVPALGQLAGQRSVPAAPLHRQDSPEHRVTAPSVEGQRT